MNRLLALALVFAASPTCAGVIEGRVIEVPDGATVTILSREGASMHRVRLAGIEAPARDRAHGNSSRESLRRLTVGKPVRVETNAIDPKGVLIGTVLVVRSEKECGGQPCAPILDPGLSQLSFGWAVIDQANLARQPESSRRQYAIAEEQARASRAGLWRVPNFRINTEVVQAR